MKKILRIPLLLVALLLTSIPLSAHDFSVDGIYYNITSSTGKTVEVSYRGSYYNSYSNEYTGSVVIPEAVTYSGTTYSVTSIGYSAFEGCTGLTEVTIPNSVTEIGTSAFEGCTGLTEVTIPNSVTSIYMCAFYGCTGLTTVNFNATNCTSMGSSTYPVFEGCTAFKTLNIGDNVTNIPSYAFYGCTDLTSVTIPNSVTSIGKSAFYGCTGLTSVTIPNSVTSIGEYAFNRCIGLTTIYSKCNTPPTIASNSFPNYKATLYVPFSTLDAYQSAEYWSNFTNIVEGVIVNKLIYSDLSASEVEVISTTGTTKNVTIPSTIVIANNAYTVTRIGQSAFKNCPDLTEITIPNSVTSIGNSAFSGCTGLTTVNFNATNCTTMGSSDYPVFNDCTAFTTLNIGDNVTNIPSSAFKGCTRLTSVTIPNSVTEIGTSAFYNCDGLTSVTIPNSVTSIGDDAFSGCTGLTSVTIPNSVTSIGDDAFSGCKGLTSVTIPNSVTSIGDGAFACCYGLTTVNFNATNCTTMGSSSYPVFNDCTAFTTLNIGDNVTNIPSSAFKGCTGLTSVTIPNSVTSIDNNSFYGCSGLTSVDLGNGVKYLGSQAFYGCVGITEITIPNSVTEINSPFRKCTGLKMINYNAVNSITTEDAEIAPGCTALTTLNIGESVMAIPNRAFYGCNRITSLSLPASVISVGNYSFYNCSDLASLSGGENLSSIGNYAFWGCNKLINANVTRTQTTATINLTSPTQYNLGLYYSDSDKKQAENGVVKFTGLKPNYTNSNYDLALIINGIYCPIKDFSFTTQSFSAYLSGSTTTTSVSAIGTYTNGDVTILGEGINYGSSVTNYDGNNTITVSNLDPNRSYTIYYAVKTQEGGVYSASKSFTTSSLTWSNGGFTATSTTSARLSVETNCDATMGTGYEWKRYDAPESLAPNKAPCPVVDGMLIGSLRNLNPEVYYKCRPYYTSSSGNTYYGEWITFFTGDANVYFEPEVRTFSERSVVNNTVTVRGYALPGTDDISEQGFEYWKVPASRATSTVMTVKASGISMTATLADLEYNSTYRYRAYVKTAQGTFYGAEEEFSTGEDPAGIEYIEVDDSNNFDVMLRENPATATAWVKVAGTSAIEAEYYILTTNGGVVANGFIPADGEYQPIELNIANGLYLMTVTDGSHRKTLRLIVR